MMKLNIGRTVGASRKGKNRVAFAASEAISRLEPRMMMSTTPLIVWNFNTGLANNTTFPAANLSATTVNASLSTPAPSLSIYNNNGALLAGGSTTNADVVAYAGSTVNLYGSDTSGTGFEIESGGTKTSTAVYTSVYAQGSFNGLGGFGYNVTFAFENSSTSTGYITDSFQYSTTGTSGPFNTLANFTPTNSFSLQSFNLSSVSAFDNNANDAFRIVLSGATSTSAYTEIDNLDVNGFVGNTPVNGTPTIGSLSISPTPSPSGFSSQLTASSVNDVNGYGTITGVNFYREPMGATSPNPSTDTLVNAGTTNTAGTTYVADTASSLLAPGTYTYYGIATDSNGATSAIVTTSLVVSPDPYFNFANNGAFTTNENNGTVQVTVDLSAPSATTQTIQYLTSDGTHFGNSTTPSIDGAALAGRDYTATSGQLNFSPGATSASFTVALTNVATLATSRTFNVTLLNNSAGTFLEPVSTASVVITDNTISTGSSTTPEQFATGSATFTAEVQATTALTQGYTSGFTAIDTVNTSYASNNSSGFGAAASGTTAATTGPSFSLIEFSPASTVFPTTYLASSLQSIQLGLYNTAISSTYGGHAGSFDLYVLTSDTGAAGTYPAYTYDTSAAVPGTTTTANGNSGATVIGYTGSGTGEGTPVYIGSASFTNNSTGYNNFIFDAVPTAASNYITTALNAKTGPLRFALVPTAGSKIAADWSGVYTGETPTLELAVVQSPVVVQAFSIDSSTVTTLNRGSVETVYVDRTGTDLSDTATVQYNTTSGSATAGTDYTAATGQLQFGANASQASFTVATLTVSPLTVDEMFNANIYSPVSNTPSGSSTQYSASIAPPSTLAITVHDGRTTDLLNANYDASTIGVNGARTGTGESNYTVVEGPASATYADFTVADLYNTGASGTPIPTGYGVSSVVGVTLAIANSQPQFTETSGAINVYVVDNTTAVIGSGTTLTYETGVDADGGVGSQLAGKHLLGSFYFSATAPANTYSYYNLTSTDATAVGIIKDDLNLGLGYRIVLEAATPNVAAEFDYGINSTPTPPEVIVDTSLAATTGLPQYLDPFSQATYNSVTNTVTVNGPTTIIANPGNSAPNIVANGPTAVLTINTASGSQVQLLSLNLSSGASTLVQNPANRAVVVEIASGTGNFLIDSTSKFDLGYDDLDVSGGSLSALTALVAKGYNLSGGGNWLGSGITSSAAAGDSTHTTAVGVISNSGNGSNQLYTTFDGDNNVSSSDILLKYTYFGDANLDGKVDGSDYSLIDSASDTNKQTPNALTGWYNGDFNYDGYTDGSDYALIDNSYNNQATQLTFAPDALVAASTAQVAVTTSAATGAGTAVKKFLPLVPAKFAVHTARPVALFKGANELPPYFFSDTPITSTGSTTGLNGKNKKGNLAGTIVDSIGTLTK